MRVALPSLFLATLVAACGPMTVERAETACFERARLAAAPRGAVALRTGSGGQTGASLRVSVSSDYVQGRDPSAVYDACVYQKSGLPPRRPLYDLPDWKG